MGVKCLAQEHNALFPRAGLEPGPLLELSALTMRQPRLHKSFMYRKSKAKKNLDRKGKVNLNEALLHGERVDKNLSKT